MAVVINSNLAALNARKNLAISQDNLATSIARLSSGMRITRASDDAAGLAISEKLNAQIRGFAVASRNASNAISVVATAEGTLNEVTSLLTRMRELAVQSASGDLGSSERGNLNTEYTALRDEIDRMVSATKFSGTNLFSTGGTVTMSFQIGINSGSGDSLAVSIVDNHVSALAGALSGSSISDSTSAATLLAGIDAAISSVTTNRGSLGAAQNRLESIIRNLAVTIETTTAANSRIRDVDVAEETASYTKNQILVQAGVSVLAQANQQPQIALSLLGGR